jgi:polysaccharide deacetylase family protein (PEP-CTERM system associated)
MLSRLVEGKLAGRSRTFLDKARDGKYNALEKLLRFRDQLSNAMSNDIVNIFSIDVEDWFHILDLKQGVDRDAWIDQESRVERNTERLLDLVRRHETQVTCFVLGWIAEHYPSLVETIYREGHEIATHGYGHQLVYEQSLDQFRQDLKRSCEVLRSTPFGPPLGYRAPGFSITKDSLWAFSILADLGLTYDSSVFPAARTHGGLQNSCSSPYRIQVGGGRSLIELPISTTRVCGRPVAYCGGGYLRLFPLKFIFREIRKANAMGLPVVLYIHPRDIDPGQPRIPMPPMRRLKSYIGLHKTYDKLNAILQEFPFGRADRVIDNLKLDETPLVRISAGTMLSVDVPDTTRRVAR